MAESESSPTAPYQPWKVYPASQWEELRRQHGPQSVKQVHFVRHAEGTHNVQKDYKSEKQIDARLTRTGYEQCDTLAGQLASPSAQVSDASPLIRALQGAKDGESSVDICLLTSPLTRCVQTALGSFPPLTGNPNVPILAQEAWRETVNYNCDRRRSFATISSEFPRLHGFSPLDAHRDTHDDNIDDPVWDTYRQRLGDDWETHMESAELHVVADRGLQGFRLIQERCESQIVVCTHSAFLRCIVNWGQKGGVPKLLPQRLVEMDLPEDQPPKQHKLFEYASLMENDEQGLQAFENYMREDYENCELRSFCLLLHTTS